MSQLLLNILGMLTGALITILAARKYYEKASADLVKEANELRQLNELMLRAMENAGLAQFERDRNGKIKGLLITLEANLTIESSVSADLTA